LNKHVNKKKPFFITAVFTGTDRSLGYRTGREYNLIVDYYHDHISIDGKHVEFCLYSSLKALLKNWDIKTVRDVDTV
jgi:hypothetical protein